MIVCHNFCFSFSEILISCCPNTKFSSNLLDYTLKVLKPIVIIYLKEYWLHSPKRFCCVQAIKRSKVATIITMTWLVWRTRHSPLDRSLFSFNNLVSIYCLLYILVHIKSSLSCRKVLLRPPIIETKDVIYFKSAFQITVSCSWRLLIYFPRTIHLSSASWFPTAHHHSQWSSVTRGIHQLNYWENIARYLTTETSNH